MIASWDVGPSSRTMLSGNSTVSEHVFDRGGTGELLMVTVYTAKQCHHTVTVADNDLG